MVLAFKEEKWSHFGNNMSNVVIVILRKTTRLLYGVRMIRVESKANNKTYNTIHSLDDIISSLNQQYIRDIFMYIKSTG